MRMKSAALAAIVALALAGPSPEALAAATRVGTTNEFLVDGGTLSFFLALTPMSGGVDMQALPLPPALVASGGDAQNNVLADPGLRVAAQLRGASLGGGLSVAAVQSGAAYGASAPVTADGTAFQGRYLMANKTRSTHGTFATLVLQDAVTRTEDVASYVEGIWGSVEAANLLTVRLRPDGSATQSTATLAGSDLLSAASALGIPGGNAGSFYVGLRAADGYSLSRLIFEPGLGNAVEFAPTAYSRTDQHALSASPAPLPALGGTIPGLVAALAALGLLRRSREA